MKIKCRRAKHFCCDEHCIFIDVEFWMMMWKWVSRSCTSEEKCAWYFFKVICEIFAAHLWLRFNNCINPWNLLCNRFSKIQFQLHGSRQLGSRDYIQSRSVQSLASAVPSTTRFISRSIKSRISGLNVRNCAAKFCRISNDIECIVSDKRADR